MIKRIFETDGKKAILCQAEKMSAPLIVLNHYAGDGAEVMQAMREINAPECSLLIIDGLRWEHDMTPWYCAPVMGKDNPFTGGADDYLLLLISDILPRALSVIGGNPAFIGIAGYSLAGLFALYAAYRYDLFERIASISGSLWFPGFKEFALTHEFARRPEKIYLSVGDREAKTRNSILKTVQRNTEEIAEYYRKTGMDVSLELNPGNHFQNAAQRCAKGIGAILEH